MDDRNLLIFTEDGEVIETEFLPDDDTFEAYCAECDETTEHHTEGDYCLECGHETR